MTDGMNFKNEPGNFEAPKPSNHSQENGEKKYEGGSANLPKLTSFLSHKNMMTVKTGGNCQAKIPTLLSKKDSSNESVVEIQSKKVWDPFYLKKDALDDFFESCEDLYIQYFGSNMPPKVAEAACLCLSRHNYSASEALVDFEESVKKASIRMAESTPCIPFAMVAGEDTTFDFIGIPEKDEHDFVESMMVCGKDLRAIGNRMVSVPPDLIVRYFYQHYKQIGLLGGSKQRGFRLVEYSLDPASTAQMEPTRIISSLRVLALSNHDAFEVDKRVSKAVTLFRNRRTWFRLIRRAQDTDGRDRERNQGN